MNIGTRIYGYCNGYFGRDDYNDKIIIHEGKTWIVCSYLDSEEVSVANFKNEIDKNGCIKDWSVKEEDY